MTKEEVLALGKKYEQDAVIWGSRGQAELLDARTGDVRMTFHRLRVLDVDTTFDDYSALRRVRKPGEKERVPVRPFRLEPEERDEAVKLALEDLKAGDVVYAEPSDRLTGSVQTL